MLYLTTSFDSSHGFVICLFWTFFVVVVTIVLAVVNLICVHLYFFCFSVCFLIFVGVRGGDGELSSFYK